ncbi:PAS domain-containing protein, partial [Actinomadura sp. NPDC049753]|uniref:PAS domain-containing protein n=1 Tax=Actinomadura sp. NPDC049753 TaxID=3154739 RepID=UPI00344A036D
MIADLLGVTRMTAVTVNDRGRINHWDDTAADLFGAARRQAMGRPPGDLLRLPREHRGAFEPEAFGHVWCGACTLRRADNGEPVEIGWWIYPIDGAPGDHGVRVLALAADLRRLRRDGIGITVGVGTLLLVYFAVGVATLSFGFGVAGRSLSAGV